MVVEVVCVPLVTHWEFDYHYSALEANFDCLHYSVVDPIVAVVAVAQEAVEAGLHWRVACVVMVDHDHFLLHHRDAEEVVDYVDGPKSL